jgi:hypothetical protein
MKLNLLTMIVIFFIYLKIFLAILNFYFFYNILLYENIIIKKS